MTIATPRQKHGHTLGTKYCVVLAASGGTSSYHTRRNAIRLGRRLRLLVSSSSGSVWVYNELKTFVHCLFTPATCSSFGSGRDSSPPCSSCNESICNRYFPRCSRKLQLCLIVHYYAEADKAVETRVGQVTAQQFGGVTNQKISQHVVRGKNVFDVGVGILYRPTLTRIIYKYPVRTAQ